MDQISWRNISGWLLAKDVPTVMSTVTALFFGPQWAVDGLPMRQCTADACGKPVTLDSVI